MADIEARRRNHYNRKHVLFCERCGRRIAWWTLALVRGHVVDHHREGWRWQGGRVPIRYRNRGVGLFGFEVDVECFSCGWHRTFDDNDVIGWTLLRADSAATPAKMRAAWSKYRREAS